MQARNEASLYLTNDTSCIPDVQTIFVFSTTEMHWTRGG